MEKKGFEVTQAESVQKGVDSVKAKKPGFAVVDLRLGRWQWTRGCKRNSKFK
jgi:two-component system response regulator RegA